MVQNLASSAAAGPLVGAGLVVRPSLPRALATPGPLRRTAMVVGDMVKAMGVVLLVPVVILAIGLPIVLALRVLLWIVGLF